MLTPVNAINDVIHQSGSKVVPLFGTLRLHPPLINLFDIIQLAIFAAEVNGIEGKLGVQAEVGNVQGIWQEIM
jgi:hypothetical protein